LYAEVLERFPFDGLNLDRVRFPDARFCHCAWCREHFKADTGIELAAEFANGSPDAAAWDRWRKQQTLGFVRRLSQAIRGRFPGCAITAAVVPPTINDEKGQDWPAWIEGKYVDAVMPMLYQRNLIPDVEWTQRRLGSIAPIYYGISAGHGAAVVSEQISALRAKGAPGFTLWEGVSADSILRDLRQGAFARPAISPLAPRPARP